MHITEKQFFEEELDHSIPELAEAARVFATGDEAGAEHIFAEYIKKTLKPECLYKIPNIHPIGDTAMKMANDTLENKYTVLGVSIDFGKDNKVDWYANPTANKYVEWEFHFHYHTEWGALAYAYQQTADEKYAKKYNELVYSWITEAHQRPLPGGPGNNHWRTLECGIRLRLWNYPIHVFLTSPSVCDKVWTLLFMSIWEQAEHIFPKNIGFNWLVTEKTGLLFAAKIYPFMAQSKRWGDWAYATILRLCEEYVYPDNFEIELSTGYHGAMISEFLRSIDLSNAYGFEIPERISYNIRRLFYMYPQLSNPEMRTPPMNDGGYINVVDTCKRGAKYFPDDQLLKYFASGFTEGKHPDYTSIIMPYSGMMVMRTGFGPDDMWAFFESAPFGADHQHEDKLNFMLYAYGVEMLPNEGNYHYDGSKMRQYVLSSRAHNTGLVDGLSQNRRQTHVRMTGADALKKSDLQARISEDFEVAEGIYNQGYGPELTDVTHKRKVIWFKKGYLGSKPFFVVIDDFASNDENEHLFESSWQLTTAPISVKANKISATYENGATLAMISSVCPRIVIGQDEPFMGWRPDTTPGAKAHFPAPVVSYAKWGKNARIVTVLYPAPDSECPITDVKLTDNGFDVSFGESAEHFDFTDSRFDTEIL